ncbi:MAG: AAA family ATPase [Chitinispirillaceae bacterium]|nr:AAA family ATPase [Chitinispirillaceae bacterium]
MRDQAEKLRELVASVAIGNEYKSNAPGSRKLCKSISFVSGKGGVGKTNIALYYAMSLAKSGKKVLLLDADLGLANIHILLGIAPKLTVADVFEGKCTIMDTVINGPLGVSIIPGASGLETLANIAPDKLHYLIDQFNTMENHYDFILVDTAAGIGSSVINVAAKTDLAILMMTPDPTSLADAYAVVKILYERGQKQIATIVNMVMSEKEGMETFDRINAVVVKFLKKPLEFLGVLPMNRELQRFIRMQRLVTENRNDEFFLRVSRISRASAGISVIRRGGFFSRFLKKV